MEEDKKQFLIHKKEGDMLLHSLKIGNVELENNILLAPMAGITDRAFRNIVKSEGAGLVCTEMVSAKALYYGDKKTEQLMNTAGEKRPISIQIFGSEPKVMGKVAKNVSKNCDILDINMGCPAPKVVKNGDGSKLLLNPELAGDIVREVVKNARVPVTVKMRIGWDSEHVVAVELAQIIEKAGASAITVHGRTREQYYSGIANWDMIKKVKESVNIPVIGNGDIDSAESAKKMLEQTNVDGIMIGRGSLGNPWIFKEVIEFLRNSNTTKAPTNKEKLQTILEHINLAIEEKGELVAVKEMRKHISWYIKNLKDATKIREKINQITSRKELEDCLIEYFNSL